MRVIRSACLLLLAAGIADADGETRQLTVRVRGPGGAVPASVQVELVESRMPRASVVVVARDGVITREVSARVRELRVSRARDSRGTALPWAPMWQEVGAKETDVVVRMPLGLSVEGRVVDEAGKGLPGLVVSGSEPGMPVFVPLPGLDDVFEGMSATTDGDGRFRLEPIGPDPIEISVLATGEFAYPPAVRAEGGARDLTITLHRVAPTEVRVVDMTGRPVPGARLKLMHWVRTKESGSATGGTQTTDEQGRASLGRLDPRLDLELELTPPDAREDLSPVTFDPWKPASGDVVLPPGFTAVLQVRDEKGRPVPAVIERLTTWEERPELGSSASRAVPQPDESGRVVVRHLPRGSHRFGARPSVWTGVWPEGSRWVEVTEEKPKADLVIPFVKHTMDIHVAPREPGQTCWLFAEDDGRELPFRTLPVPEDGIVRFTNLGQGDYSVYVLTNRTPGEGGLAGSYARFTLDGAPVRIATAPGLVLRVRPRSALPGLEVTSMWLFLNGRKMSDLHPSEDGTWWGGGGLPPGRYGVRAWGRSGKQSLAGQVFLEPGGPIVELELTPFDP